jgi:hypothetical protein
MILPILRLTASSLALATLFLIASDDCFAEPPQTKSDQTKSDSLLAPYQTKAVEKWQKDIDALLDDDVKETYGDDAVLFIGSSSIRLWKSIAEDVAPYTPINRGYGGAKFSDLAVFAKQLITPHRYRAIVIFAANDVTGSKEDISAEEVEQLTRYICDISLAHQPQAPILIVEVTPTPSRFAHYDKIRLVNDRLRSIALTKPGTHFVATAEYYLNEAKQPRAEYFIEDKLHQNETGYDLWGRLITQRLNEVLASVESGE